MTKIFDIETRKPKVLWLALLSTVIFMLFGALAIISRQIIQIESLHYFLFFAVVFFWLLTMVLIVIYYFHQITGRYILIKKVKLRDQIW